MMDGQCVNPQTKFVHKPQWRYFDMPGVIFKDNIRYDDSHNKLAYDTNYYRSMLYAFMIYRKFLKFEFSYKTQDAAPRIQLHFGSSEVKYKFFRQIFDDDPFQISESNIKKNATRLTELINKFFFQFVNDLASVSQKNGPNLFPYIYPPGLVQSYYNMMVVSKAMIEEYNRVKECYGEAIHPFAQSVRSYLQGYNKRPSDDVLKVIWAKVACTEGITQDEFIRGMVRKFNHQRLEFHKEAKYLTCSNNGSKSGPVSSICNPAVSSVKNRTHGSTIPSYRRLDKESNEIDERFKICENFLKEWRKAKEFEPVPGVDLSPGMFQLELPEKPIKPVAKHIIKYPAKFYKSYANPETERPSTEINSQTPSEHLDQNKSMELYSPEKPTSNPEPLEKPTTKPASAQKEPPINTVTIKSLGGSSEILFTDALKVLSQYGPQNPSATISKSSGLSLLVSQYNDEESEVQINLETNKDVITIPSLNQKNPISNQSSLDSLERQSSDLLKRVAVVNPLSPKSSKISDSPALLEKDLSYITDSSEMSADFEYLHMLNGDYFTTDNNSCEQKLGDGKVDKNNEEVEIEVIEDLNPQNSLTTSKNTKEDGPASKKQKISDNPIVQVSDVDQQRMIQKTGSENLVPELVTIDEDVTEVNPESTVMDSNNNSSIKECPVIDLYNSEEEENDLEDVSVIACSKVIDVFGRPVGRPRKIRSQKVDNIKDSLLFKAISVELTKYMSTENYKNRFIDSELKAGPFSLRDKKMFLTFLQDHHFLCEITNPALHEILCHFKFLGRQEVAAYKSFVTELQVNLSVQLENIFKKPSENSLMFYLYQNLREQFG